MLSGSASTANSVQGKLDVRALRAITGQIDARLAICAEDEFARNWIEVALRRCPGQVALDAVEVHSMQGDGTSALDAVIARAELLGERRRGPEGIGRQGMELEVIAGRAARRRRQR
jgi:hypothetical protein